MGKHFLLVDMQTEITAPESLLTNRCNVSTSQVFIRHDPNFLIYSFYFVLHLNPILILDMQTYVLLFF